MSVDPSVLSVLRAALDRDPENASLRLHYADLLLQSGQHKDALSQFAIVLEAQPDNREALKKAADAADGADEKIKAAGYRRLANALDWDRTKSLIDSTAEPVQPSDPPQPVPLKEYAEEPEEEPIEDKDIERPEITLKDVAGMEHVKRRLHTAFLGPIRNPDLRKLYGKSLKGGLLLYGPPGCGKTYIARAVAGEMGARFIGIGITDVLDMYHGESERHLHEHFQRARRNTPCVLFFDEIDAIGRKRSLMREHVGRNVINQFLNELDGSAENEGVFVLAATNHPWDVDSALRRPGRFDRTLLVLPPDEPARRQVFRLNLSERPTKDIDYAWLAGRTEDYSGADIAHCCESAAEMALESSISTGVARPIQMNDLKSALKEVRQSTRTWFESAKNYALYANEGGLYDDLLEYLKSRKMV